jgi:serine protease Do
MVRFPRIRFATVLLVLAVCLAPPSPSKGQDQAFNLLDRPVSPAPSTARNTGYSVAGLRVMQAQIQKAVQQATPAIVAVAGGTGVIVSEDGLVLTCAHVNVESGRDVEVEFSDGRKVPAKTLGNHHGLDAGMIRLQEPGPWPTVPLGDSDSVDVGQWCVALGYPISFAPGKLPGARLGRIHYVDSNVLMSDCTIMGGDSGGALLDLEGKLIGICSSCDDPVTENASVPINIFHEFWDQLERGEEIDASGEAATTTLRNALADTFDEQTERWRRSVVRLMIGDQPIGLATIVTSDRLAVAKASTLTPNVIAVDAAGTEMKFEEVRRDEAYDLVLIRLSGDTKLEPIAMEDVETQTGQMVANLDEDGKSFAIGLIMTPLRVFEIEIPTMGRGFLGVSFVPDDSGYAKITEVVADSAAELCGLRVDDVVAFIDQTELTRERSLPQILSGTAAGQRIILDVRRGTEQLYLEAALAEAPRDESDVPEYDGWGGGPFSERRFGFPAVIAHDSTLHPDDVGGPLIDVEGRVLGINIARTLRVVSYAAPISVIKRLVEAAANPPTR